MKDLLEMSPDAAIAVEALSQLPKATLATALVFAIAESITLQKPNDEKETALVLGAASMEAMELAEGIDVIFNNTNVTRH